MWKYRFDYPSTTLFGVKENSFLIIGPFAFISPFCTLVRGGILFYHHEWWRVKRTSCALTCKETTHQKDSRERLSNRMLPLSCSISRRRRQKKVIWALKAFVAHLSGLYQALSLWRKPLDEPVLDECQCRRWQGRWRGNVHFFSLSIVNEGTTTWPKKGERWMNERCEGEKFNGIDENEMSFK